jgi:hypothetical protein
MLPLCTEYDFAAEAAATGTAGAAAAARGPSLKIELSYRAQLCTMAASEAAATVVAAAAAVATAPAAEASAAGCLPGSGRKRREAAAAASEPCCGSAGSGSSDSDSENSLQAANRQPVPAGAAAAAAAVSRRGQPSAPPMPAARAAATAAGAPARPAEPSVPATLSVEIIRACGLAAAVREASAAAGAAAASSGHASSLSRAAAVGPHAFARLALFTEGGVPRLCGQLNPMAGLCIFVVGLTFQQTVVCCSIANGPTNRRRPTPLFMCRLCAAAAPELQEQVPTLQTPFETQSFCPTWRAAHSYRLHLTGAILEALASQVGGWIVQFVAGWVLIRSCMPGAGLPCLFSVL